MMEEVTIQTIESEPTSKVTPAVELKEEVLEQLPKQNKEEAKEQEKILNENLIAAIKLRSFLIDPNDSNHFNTPLLTRTWAKVAEEVGRDAKFCMTRWRSLRDHFVRKYTTWKSRPEVGKPTWPWFDLMRFLKEDFNIPEDKIKTKDPEPRKKLKKVRGEDELFKSDCLFCCESIPVRKDELGGNFRENSKIIDYFCKAWRISGDLYAGQMELAPFCRNCVGIIESVGVLMESIDALKIKLSSKKNLILEMLKKEYRRDEDVEEKLYSAFAFSPSNFRQQLVEQFRKHDFRKDKAKTPSCPNDVDSIFDDLTAVSPSPTIVKTDAESDEDWDPPSPILNSGAEFQKEIVETRKTRKVIKVEPETKFEYKIPEGVVIRDCFVPLERVKVSARQLSRSKTRKVKKKKKKKRSEGKQPPIRLARRINPDTRQEDPKQCPLCPRVLAHARSLQDHMKLHTGKKDFVCDICGEGFRTTYLFLKHRVKSHGEKYPFVCELCSMGFVRPVELRYHSYTHTGNWPVKCEECGAGFCSKANLERHKPYCPVGKDAPSLPCKYCYKKFTTTFLLEKHEALHYAPTTHKCPLCPSAFINVFRLQSHMRAHSDKRDFICHLCGADFKYASNLRIHVASHDQRKMTFAKRNRQKNREYASIPNESDPSDASAGYQLSNYVPPAENTVAPLTTSSFTYDELPHSILDTESDHDQNPCESVSGIAEPSSAVPTDWISTCSKDSAPFCFGSSLPSVPSLE